MAIHCKLIAGAEILLRLIANTSGERGIRTLDTL